MTENMDDIVLEALPVEQFKEGEVVKLYAPHRSLNDFLSTSVFDIQKPLFRPVSTQVLLLISSSAISLSCNDGQLRSPSLLVL